MVDAPYFGCRRTFIMVSTSVIGSLRIHGLAEYIGYRILRRGHDYGVLSAYPSHAALLLPRDSPAFIVLLVTLRHRVPSAEDAVVFVPPDGA